MAEQNYENDENFEFRKYLEKTLWFLEVMFQ